MRKALPRRSADFWAGRGFSRRTGPGRGSALTQHPGRDPRPRLGSAESPWSLAPRWMKVKTNRDLQHGIGRAGLGRRVRCQARGAQDGALQGCPSVGKEMSSLTLSTCLGP